MKRIILLGVAAIALGIFAIGCSTGAHVNTPIVDVGAGVDVD